MTRSRLRALNNAIQWSKDEAREEDKRQKREDEVMRQMKVEQTDKRREADESSLHSSQAGSRRVPPSSKSSAIYGLLYR